MEKYSGNIFVSSGKLWEGIEFAVENISRLKPIAETHNGHRIAVNLGNPHYGDIKSWGHWRKQLYEKGAIGLVPYGEVNECRARVDIVCATITLQLEFLEKTFGGTTILLLQTRGVNDSVIYHLALALREELINEHFIGRFYAESLAHILVLHIARTYPEDKNRIFYPKGKLTAGQLKRAVDYCYEMRETGFSLSDLAKEVNLSIFHFARLFKQTIGYSPWQFLQNLKIEEAKKLIRSRRNSLTEIAYQLGFADQAHFCKAFRKVTGISPGKF
ncbi:helix-turn-helix domain-containing protein [Arachidicoccus soli]|uniref:AraC family transcriptional regulator n=1 Tax=Arachidicoccus soli TaxID=2341117 RepID=A0A386HRZ1_9BACT|nr:helix-turn-helix transcriptional regulator [Arachidicoccus soli]AYD48336.1 AraC family transcriptional regulator [Arachidicoccus soli]